MKNLRKLAIIPALAATLAMTACSAGRPSVDELQTALSQSFEQEAGALADQLPANVKQELTKCMAEKIHSSDLKDDTIRKVVDAANKGESIITGLEQEEKNKLDSISQTAATECGEQVQDQMTNTGGR